MIRAEVHYLSITNMNVIISAVNQCQRKKLILNSLTEVTLNKCNTTIVDKNITMECYC